MLQWMNSKFDSICLYPIDLKKKNGKKHVLDMDNIMYFNILEMSYRIKCLI